MKSMYLSIALLSANIGFAQTGMETHYKIYDTHLKKEISLPDIISGSRNADVLFFGEEHNDSACHYMEDTLFKALYGALGDRLALSLEMIESDGQITLDEYLKGFIPEDRFAKDVRLWSNYKDYRPMVEFAKKKGMDVVAANTPRRYVSMVTKRGMASLDSLSKSSRTFLPPLPYDTLPGRYREHFIEVMQGSPGGGNPNVYYSQNLWDAGMSYRIQQYLKRHKHSVVFHCVGRFHCDEKLGTLAQLQKRNPKLRIMNISSFSDASFAHPDWDKFSYLGDFVILTDPDLKKTF